LTNIVIGYRAICHYRIGIWRNVAAHVFWEQAFAATQHSYKVVIFRFGTSLKMQRKYATLAGQEKDS